MPTPDLLNRPSTPLAQTRKAKLLAWLHLFTLAVLLIYFYVSMEWLFYATKPSFMNFMPFGTKLGILLLPGLLFGGVSLPVLLALLAASFIPPLARFWKLFLGIGAAVPAAFLSATALMLVDNFTYTVLKFGIVDAQGVWRGVYGLLLAAFFVLAMRWVIRALAGTPKRRMDSGLKAKVYASAALLLLSIPLGGGLYLSARAVDAVMATGAPARQPNILLIGTDGLDADKTSIYGSQAESIDNTPFMRTFAGQSLLAENNFPNANITSGSLVSIFTSKLPTQTRMLYPPDVLRGSDAFQHLPGILKKAGYYNAEISVDYYADPEMLNVQDGFVMVNGRSATIGRLYTFSRRYLPENAAYFLSVIAKRLTDRLMHIFYIRSMPNPYAEVTHKLSEMSDDDRIGMILSLFHDIRQPLFIHAHLMGTHTTDPLELSDSIVAYDQRMRGLIDELQKLGKLEQTIIIVYTDHGNANTNRLRVPLMFRFPNGEHAGQIVSNTQNLDIAPTILDYLGVQPPAWMSGQSLLKGQPPATRPVFSMSPSFRIDKSERLQLDLAKVKPPFYQFGTISMMVCQNWYALDTTSLTWQRGEISGYPTPCQLEALPDEQQARQMIVEELMKDGFDVSEILK